VTPDKQAGGKVLGGSTKVFADGADRKGIAELRDNPYISGFTTNPSLMRQAGVEDYEAFARDIIELVPDYPISFEVFSDDFAEMEHQALKIASWGSNVYVKVPITDTSGNSTAELQRRLSHGGVKLNVTALFTVRQVEVAASALGGGPPACISVFAGRIADAGVDPVPIMSAALDVMRAHANLELIWASPREILNIVQASQIGCHIITVTHDLLKKLPILGKDLDEYSLETVQMFFRDATAARYTL
jgi:transaldolase